MKQTTKSELLVERFIKTRKAASFIDPIRSIQFYNPVWALNQ